MDKDDMKFFGLVIIGYLIGGLLLYGHYWAITDSPQHIEKVKCFDRFANEIKGLTCDNIVYENPIAGFFVSPLSILLGMIMVTFITLGIFIRITSQYISSKVE